MHLALWETETGSVLGIHGDGRFVDGIDHGGKAGACAEGFRVNKLGTQELMKSAKSRDPVCRFARNRFAHRFNQRLHRCRFARYDKSQPDRFSREFFTPVLQKDKGFVYSTCDGGNVPRRFLGHGIAEVQVRFQLAAPETLKRRGGILSSKPPGNVPESPFDNTGAVD
jgi:hypothetical protein